MNWLKNIFKKVEPPKLNYEELLKIKEEDHWRYLADIANSYFDRNNWRTFEKDIIAFEEPLKTFYITHTFESEVYNGGLLQFFTNSSGELSPYISQALIKIGANKSEEIFKKAIAVITAHAESNKSLRQNLSKIKQGEVFQFSMLFDNQQLVDELDKLDTIFFKTEEAIDKLSVSFVLKSQNA